MGVMAVCTYGYPTRSCRCPQRHDPVQVVSCEPGHVHRDRYDRLPDGVQPPPVGYDDEVAVDTTLLDQAAFRVFATFPGDCWRDAPLREVVAAALGWRREDHVVPPTGGPLVIVAGTYDQGQQWLRERRLDRGARQVIDAWPNIPRRLHGLPQQIEVRLVGTWEDRQPQDLIATFAALAAYDLVGTRVGVLTCSEVASMSTWESDQQSEALRQRLIETARTTAAGMGVTLTRPAMFTVDYLDVKGEPVIEGTAYGPGGQVLSADTGPVLRARVTVEWPWYAAA